MLGCDDDRDLTPTNFVWKTTKNPQKTLDCEAFCSRCETGGCDKKSNIRLGCGWGTY